MPALTPDMIDFLASGVSHQLGGCDRHGRPSLCRALAAAVEDDGRLLVLLCGVAGFEVLDAIRTTGQVSVVFALPQDFSALHVKGSDAVVSAAGPACRALLEQSRRAFDAQLAPFGFAPDYTLAWYGVPDDDLVAVRLTPNGAWNQTPGPGAGSALELQA